MLRNKKKIAYCIAMLLVIIWLIISTDTIIKLNDELEVPKKISIVEFHALKNDEINDQFHYRIDEVRLDPIMESIDFAGYALVAIDGDNSNRYTSLFLVGDTDCYELRFKDYFWGGTRLTAFSANMPNAYVDCRGNFSTLKIPSGNYRAYIYTWENETNYCMDDTGYQLVKNDKEFAWVPWTSSQVTPPVQVTESDSSLQWVDSASLESQSGRIIIKGWAFADGEDAAKQTVYVVLQNNDGEYMQYRTKPHKRVAVVKIYGSLYENSGFTAEIPAEDLSDGEWKLQVYVQHGERVWTAFTDVLIKSGNFVELHRNS